MKIWGISDLHLSFSTDKPMDIFGDHWLNHADQMAFAWDKIIHNDDLVLCPGDLSWAMKLEEAKLDLDWIGQRPGLKLLVKGNHDLWWSSISKVRNALPSNCIALQNDAYDAGELVIAGSRLWNYPASPDYTAHDEKIYVREVERLKLSLTKAKNMAKNRPILAAVHYPPIGKDLKQTMFSQLLEEFGVKICVYGHLHGQKSFAKAFEGQHNGITYMLLSCDYLKFTPKLVWPLKTSDVTLQV